MELPSSYLSLTAWPLPTFVNCLSALLEAKAPAALHDGQQLCQQMFDGDRAFGRIE